MFGNKTSSRFAGRIVFFALFFTTILSISAAGSDAAVFSFVESVNRLIGFGPNPVIADNVSSRDAAKSSTACIPPPAGMVAWWPGDGNANDIQGPTFENGTLVGGTTFAPGMVSQAFSMDGSDDYVSMPDGIVPSSARNFSVDAWVYAHSVNPSGENHIVYSGPAGGGEFYLANRNGNFEFAVYLSGSGWYRIGAAADTGTWRHLTGVRRGTQIEIWIDGILRNSRAVPDADLVSGASVHSSIGSYGRGIHGFWDGLIDEVEIFSTALSATDIAAIYNAGSAGKCRSCTPPPSGLVGWWPGNGNGNDIVNGNNGTLVNAVTYAPGMVDQAFSFPQVTEQLVELPVQATQLLNNSAGSITAWVNPSAVGEFDMVTAFGSGQPGEAVGFGINNGNVRIYHHDYGSSTFDWETGIPVGANTWTFLAYTWDGTTERLYKNGALADSRVRNFNYVPGYGRIGYGFINDAAVFFPGQIDEVAIFNRKLEAGEISAIYNAGTAGVCWACAPPPANMLTWWPGDGNGNDIQGPTFENGTLLNGTTFAAGKVGQAFSFDGVDDLVRADNATVINGGPQATYDAWVYPVAVPPVDNYLAILSVGDATVPTWTTQQCRLLYWRTADSPAGSARFYVDCGLDNNTVSYFSRMSAQNYPINNWHFVAATFNNGALDLFVNGVLDNGVTAGPGGTSINTESYKYVSIGALVRNDGSLIIVPLTGRVDEPEIYDRALTAADIQAIYNAGSAGKCRTCAPPPGGMTVWWPGEDNANDIQGPTFENATLVNGTTYAAGKVGRAFGFDGVNDWVEAPAGVGDFGSGPFTVDFWMKSNANGIQDSPTFILGKDHANGGLGWDIRQGDNTIRVVGVDGWHINITSDASAVPNQWHHIALASTASTVDLYIDGILKGTSPRSTISSTVNPFRIGYTTDFGSPAFNGLIDEVEIFDRALTVNEIASIYNAGAAGKCRSTIPAGTYTNLSLPDGASLGGDVTVVDVLTLGGIVNTGSFTLTLGCSATVEGAGPSSYVIGNVEKIYCGTGAFSFPVGSAADGSFSEGTELVLPLEYSPFTADVTSGIFPASLTVSVTDGFLPDSHPTESASRYWNVTETGSLTADISFAYLDQDINGNEGTYRILRRSGSTSVYLNGTITPGTNTVLANAVTDFSGWAAGNLSPTAAAVSLAGRVTTANGQGIRNAFVTLSGGGLAQPVTVLTGSFGYYQFNGLIAGETYVVTVGAKRFRFAVPSQIVTISDSVSDVDFTANPLE